MTDIYKAPAANFADPASSGPSDFTISAALSEAWAKTHGNKGTIWLAFGLYMLVVIPISLVLQHFLKEGMFADGMRFVVTNSVDVALAAGMWMLGVKLASGVRAEAKEVYAYIEYFPRLLATYMLMNVLVVAGFLLLILPGIYLAIAYSASSILIVDKKLGIWEALETSRKALTHCWFRVFFLALAYLLIMILSALPLGIGLIWTLPMGVVLKGIVYREVFGFAQVVAETA
ncbi:MAG TPA: YciC family protein [Noviherbaspirillum sp.]